MEKAKKNLKVWSILYIILAIIDVVSIIGAYLSGDLKVSNISENMQTSVLIVVIGLAILMALAKLFLGIQGYRQANDKTKGTGHITFAKIIFVLSIITCVASILDIINGYNYRKISDLCLNLFSLLVIFDYIKQAKYIKENN